MTVNGTPVPVPRARRAGRGVLVQRTDPVVLHVPVETAPGREHRVQLLLGLSIPYILTGPDRVPLVAPSASDKTLTAAGARP